MTKFRERFRVYPKSFMSEELNDNYNYITDGIILPQSVLNKMKSHESIFTFKLYVAPKYKTVHCSVDSFSGTEEGVVFLPSHIMEYLCLKTSDYIYVEYKELATCTDVEFELISEEFDTLLMKENVIQSSLCKFITLTKDQIVPIWYFGKLLQIKVSDITGHDDIESTNLYEDYPGYLINNTDINLEYVNRRPVKHTECVCAECNMKRVKISKQRRKEKPQTNPHDNSNNNSGLFNTPGQRLGGFSTPNNSSSDIPNGSSEPDIKGSSLTRRSRLLDMFSNQNSSNGNSNNPDNRPNN